MTEAPILSVRLMTYNHEDYIAKCIESILEQETNFNIEIVIGDDFSQDRTLEICEKYAKKYLNIIRILDRNINDKYYINRKKYGRLYNFYDTLMNCKGEYIALIDGDDYWTDPLKLQKQVDFLESNPDYVICGHDAIIVDECSNIINKSKLPESQKKDCLQKQLLRGFFILTLAACFRNKVSQLPLNYFSKVNNGDSFLFSYLGQFGHYKFMPEILPAAYRAHEGGVWSLVSEEERFISSLSTQYWKGEYFRSIHRHDIADYYIVHMIDHLLWHLGKTKIKNIIKVYYHVNKALINNISPSLFTILEKYFKRKSR